MEAFTIKNLTFQYPITERVALDKINISIQEGDFVVLCGMSGSGKSTLLKHLKPSLTPHGKKNGEILFKGKHIEELDHRKQTKEIGYVLQNPENQIVTDKVWHELAFGLESLGMDTPSIRLRVAEMANFFGIQGWFHREVTDLSGGQKQLLNLASIMAMQPEVLILDEPTSQLDPIAAIDFLETVKKINRELGTTILLSEHRLEEAMPMADHVIVMDQGSIISQGSVMEVGEELKQKKDKMFIAMPSAMQLFAQVENQLTCPVTVRQGRKWMEKVLGETVVTDIYQQELRNKDVSSIGKIDRWIYPGIVGFTSRDDNVLIRLRELWFRYEKESNDVIKGLNLTIKKGEFIALVGGNGSGKTTLLSILCGLRKPYRGKIHAMENDLKFGLLPQNPQTIFVKKTVQLDLLEMLRGKNLSQEEKQKKIDEILSLIHMEDYKDTHPYDLSGGEQQKVALGKILLMDPEVLLLDEPTKGLDGFFKQELAEIINNLLSKNKTVIAVSHDIEFCARHTDRCAMLFDGDIITVQETKKFFLGNSFYTTAANRISRHFFSDCITVEEVAGGMRGALNGIV